MHPLGNIATLSCPLITYWLYHIKWAVIRTVWLSAVADSIIALYHKITPSGVV